jgi:antirestriction protein ArdC
MSETSAGTSSSFDIYQIVTDRIISVLEKGTIPWKQPWNEAGPPSNLLSKRTYRGINTWLLASLGYEHNGFLTWDQIKKAGASVCKGEQGHVVVFWKTVTKGKTLEESEEHPQQKPQHLLRYYKVFNVSQIKDLPANMVSAETQENEILSCEAIISSMPQCPPIKHKESSAFYAIDEDYINMPKKRSFKDQHRYYATLFHELVHSTGHTSRLNRKTVTEMAELGSKQYSIEELIAEMGACYLCNTAGILPQQIENSAAYIDAWLQKLKNDKRFILFAAASGQRAADFILNVKEAETKDEVEQPETISN